MTIAFKIIFTWIFAWLVISCPIWGSHLLTVFGLSMVAVGALAAGACAIVFMWREM